MTLLEILRQELPKRGGWPEGVREIYQDWDFTLTFDGIADRMKLDELAINHRKNAESKKPECIVTREQYEATGWDGTGLPPVGTVCEVKRAVDWVECKILFISSVHVVLMADEECSWNTVACQFRPIRTKAERAIDEMVRLSGVSIGAAKILYDAGYRKG